MTLLHVHPQTDDKAHIVSLTEPCWCEPQRLDEGADGSATFIHRPLRPMIPSQQRGVPAHGLSLTKTYLTGAPLTDDDLPKHLGSPHP